MNQMGLKLNASSLIDQLTYTYINNSNQLKAVTDAADDNTSTLGDFKYDPATKTTTDYTYDGNGNLMQDKNKAISSIAYNYLNLPQAVTVTAKGTVTYTYDAAGNKLRKVTVDNTITPAKTTTTDYIGPFVYQNDTLQYIGMEEGRTRPTSLRLDASDTMYYDYFEKDHLGDTRVVLTDQKQQDVYPVADMESEYAQALATEEQYYTIDESKIIADNTVTGFTESYYNNNGNPPYNTNPNAHPAAYTHHLYKLNGSSGAQTGLGITLKVMSGDVIDIFGKSYYFQNNTTGGNNNLALADVITGLLGTPTGAVTGHGATLTTLTAGANPTTIPTSFLTRNPAGGDVVPMAYINYVLFDDQFHYVAGGFSRVNQNGVVEDHHADLQNIAVTKNGYIYIYCSNQSPVDVFFDNLQVVHTRGPLLECDNYYPFGLKQTGICDNAAGELVNKKKLFQGQEYNDDLGVDIYEFKYRMDDPQTGRFWQIDPLADKYVYNSTYAFSEDKVTGHVELEGLEAIIPVLGTDPIAFDIPLEDETASPTTTETPSSGFSQETLENMNRGRQTEKDQLQKNGLDKNNNPIEAVDPKTGKSGTTVPDAMENDGKSTVEIKDVKYQGLTKQLRLQEKISNDNGLVPRLILRPGAEISNLLKNSSFKIEDFKAFIVTEKPVSDKTLIQRPIDPTKIKPIALPKAPIQLCIGCKSQVLL